MRVVTVAVTQFSCSQDSEANLVSRPLVHGPGPARSFALLADLFTTMDYAEQSRAARAEGGGLRRESYRPAGRAWGDRVVALNSVVAQSDVERAIYCACRSYSKPSTSAKTRCVRDARVQGCSSRQHQGRSITPSCVPAGPCPLRAGQATGEQPGHRQVCAPGPRAQGRAAE